MNDQAQTKSQPAILELREQWTTLSSDERVARFVFLSPDDADELFLSLNAADQSELILALPATHRRHWIRLLAPDDVTDVIQASPPELREEFLAALDLKTRHEVNALLAYAEDEAGGLMNPRFIRVRPDMSTEEALRYLRKQSAGRVETMRYVYVLDTEQRLLGVVSLRSMFTAKADELLRDIMRTGVVTVAEDTPQEQVKEIFRTSSLMAVPVLDVDGRMVGIVTIDDIVDVAEEEATEDIQRLGGSEVLDAPYLKISLPRMIKKRASWLVILLLGEMLTASAMGHYEKEIERAVVLALFIPLVISSGGNTGSQASTLVVRAIALGEVRLRDWWRVFLREIIVGSALGLILGIIGALRIVLWPTRETLYGPHFALIGATIGVSLVGIVLWGSLSGSMLPFLLKRLGLDPAVASAPFVATLVDVSGLVIYFTAASLILRGTLL